MLDDSNLNSILALAGLYFPAKFIEAMHAYRNGRSHLQEAGLLGARATSNEETVHLGRLRRNSSIAALTSAGRSCWVQCPQRGSI